MAESGAAYYVSGGIKAAAKAATQGSSYRQRGKQGAAAKGQKKTPAAGSDGGSSYRIRSARRCRDTVALCAKACNRSSFLDRNISLSIIL